MKNLKHVLFGTLAVLAVLFLTGCWQKDHPVRTSLNVDTSTLTLAVGESATRTATTKAQWDYQITYTSSNPAVATVDQNGKVTAVSEGEAVITVSMDETIKSWYAAATRSYNVVVKELKIIDKSTMKMRVGDTGQLTATLAPDATDKTVTWSSDKPAIASVDATGKVTAVAVGTATITAKAGDKTATCTVTVNNAMLTMEALTSGTIVIKKPRMGMKYRKNNETKVTISSTDDVTIDVVAGDKVAFCGDGTSITSYYTSDSDFTSISGGTADVKVYGDIMSLVDEEGLDTATSLVDRAFQALFKDNTLLKDASGLLLPATTLAASCYESMFLGCTSLTTAPSLPATTLASSCYHSMFRGCSSLTTAPALPATTLASSCYNSMFWECKKLSSVTCLATDITATWCTNDWLTGAGTDASVTSRTLHIKTGQSTTDANWKLSTSGDGTTKKWTAVADQ